jgi:hypothetical protein
LKLLRDHQGIEIRLTDERLEHILAHPEMASMEPAVAETLARPERVVRSRSDDEVRLYYRFYPETRVGDKFLCVVVKARTDRQGQGRRVPVERDVVKLWYDPEGDYLEVTFERKEGFFRETEDDRVMERVDAEGNVLGFSIQRVSSLKGKPFEVALT